MRNQGRGSYGEIFPAVRGRVILRVGFESWGSGVSCRYCTA